MSNAQRTFFGLVAAFAVTGCSESVGPSGGTATVQGSVEETSPAPAPASAAAQAPAQPAVLGAEADSVSVVQVQSNGDFTVLARGEVEADGSFVVPDVPAGREDLAVFAYAGGQVVGNVLIHERSRSGVVILTAPINQETTVEARTYLELRASGDREAASSELALLLHLEGAAAEVVASSSAELDAVASGYVAASSTMTEVLEASGVTMDAKARAELLQDVAVEFATSRHAGMSLSSAHAAFTDAALEVLAAGGASAEASVTAWAAAASAFDAALESSSSVRTQVVAQSVVLNLRARERLAAESATSSEASLGAAIGGALGAGTLELSAAGGLIDLRAIVEATADAAAAAAVDGAVDLLAATASPTVRAEVRAGAEAALEAARLSARLEGATTVEAISSAVVGYRAAVRAAVDAMIAAAGSTTVSADVMTKLFIAACGGAYIRA